MQDRLTIVEVVARKKLIEPEEVLAGRMEPGEVLAGLTELEMLGLVRRDEAGGYDRVAR